MLRLIDALSDAGVQKSPYLGRPASELGEDHYPVYSRRLEDLGAGENGLGLKRKIKLGSSELNILFAPPASEYAVEAEIPAGAVLDFGMGIVRDEYSEIQSAAERAAAAEAENGANFFVSLEISGRRRTLYQKHLTMPAVRAERTLNFVQQRIEIPPLSRTLRLILRTTGAEACFAFWTNPVLYVPSAGRPNIVLVSIDTLRADHLGCYGYARETSPAMDALARDGAVFTRTYASSPWTLPSHVSMLTGLHTVHHQVYGRANQIDPVLPTLADLLRQGSYYCAATTGGAYLDPMFGFSKGFDEYAVRGGETDLSKLAEDRFHSVSRWLEENSEKSFFLFVHTYQVHSPYGSPEPYNSKFLDPDAMFKSFDVIKDLDEGRGVFRPVSEATRRNIVGLYDGEIRYTDEVLIAALVDKLRDLGLYDRTLLIVTSDHGEQFYEHGAWNHGNFLFNDTLQVPLIIKFPGSRHKGDRVETPVRIVDLLPTILDEVGLPSGKTVFDGSSLLPLLSKRTGPPRPLLADVIDPEEEYKPGSLPRRVAVSGGPIKVVFDQGFPPGYLEAQIFRPPDRRPVEAYDLETDSGETTDVSAAHADLVRNLRAEVEDLFRKAVPRRTIRATMSAEIENQLRALGYIR